MPDVLILLMSLPSLPKQCRNVSACSATSRYFYYYLICGRWGRFDGCGDFSISMDGNSIPKLLYRSRECNPVLINPIKKRVGTRLYASCERIYSVWQLPDILIISPKSAIIIYDVARCFWIWRFIYRKCSAKLTEHFWVYGAGN